MAALVAGIHALLASRIKGVDGRDTGERSDAVLRTAMHGHDVERGSIITKLGIICICGRRTRTWRTDFACWSSGALTTRRPSRGARIALDWANITEGRGNTAFSVCAADCRIEPTTRVNARKASLPFTLLAALRLAAWPVTFIVPPMARASNARLRAEREPNEKDTSAKSLICGRSSMVERQLPKLHTRVRFPPPAPFKASHSKPISYWISCGFMLFF